jgi:uncharacterized protein (TIGR02271 family)
MLIEQRVRHPACHVSTCYFTRGDVVKARKPSQDQQSEPELSGTPRTARDWSDATVIPVMQEELDVRTRRVETESGVRVSKTIEQDEQIVDEPLTREQVEVERVAINRPVEAPIGIRYEGDTMIIPIFEEVLVVEKRLVLKEEIHVTRRRTEIRAPQRVTLRRELADVERIEDRGSRSRRERDPATTGENAESLLERKRREDEEQRRSLSSRSKHD